MKKVKVLKTLAVIWLIGFGILFTLGMVSIVVTDGIGKALWIMSPFNFASFVVNIISVSPTIVLFWIAGKIEKKDKQAPEKT